MNFRCYQYHKDFFFCHFRNVNLAEENETDSDGEQNYRLNYQKALLTFNLLLRAINDAIREGDGDRLYEFYRVALLYFRCYGRNKYAYSILKSLFRIKMEPKSAFSLIWERFVNTRGIKGHNISMDLHMEHLNNFLKELLRDLRSNLNEENANRISKALNNLKSIVESFESEMEINHGSSSKNKAKTFEDVRNLCLKMMEQNPFSEESNTKNNSYESFPKFKEQLLSKLDIDKLFDWAKDKKKEFEILYM